MDARLNLLARGVVFATAYAVVFFLLWRVSIDQMFLPAGLRIVCLLLLPSRFWPWMLVGDIAVNLWLRAPKVELYGELWAYGSPFLLGPSIALVPILSRKRWDVLRHPALVPVLLATTALWMQVVNGALNASLDGPSSALTLTNFVRFGLGCFTGMLALLLPALLWARRGDNKTERPPYLLRDSAIAMLVLAVLFVAAAWPSAIDPQLKKLLLVLMVVPAAALTFTHGWRGAAFGVSAGILTIHFTLPRVEVIGLFDADAFVAQVALILTGSGLLMLGATISKHYATARALGATERSALQLAQLSFGAGEQLLRDRVEVLAHVQSILDDARRQLASKLRDAGHPGAAMEVLREAGEHTELFDAHAAALYPLELEKHGLYAVLQAPGFAAVWAQGGQVRCFLRGKVRMLSVDLQLVAYRCVCDAAAILGGATGLRISARAWHVHNQRGVVLVVSGSATSSPIDGRSAVLADLTLHSRARIHGGAVRRRGNRIVLALVEPTFVMDAAQGAGTTAQMSPSTVL